MSMQLLPANALNCRTICLCSLWVLTALPAQAQVYKWVDANGKTQYSDTAPATAPAKLEELKVAPVSESGFHAQSWQEQEIASKQRRALQRQAEERSDATHSSPDRTSPEAQKCATARSIVAGIKEKHMYRKNLVTGSKVLMDDSERVLFEQDVKAHCH